jgi:hypothetical protein
MVCRPVKAALYNFLTADGRPQTAALEKNRRRRSAVGGQICKDRLNHARITNYELPAVTSVRRNCNGGGLLVGEPVQEIGDADDTYQFAIIHNGQGAEFVGG